MKRITIPIAVILASAVAAVAAQAAAAPTVKLANTSLGKILVSKSNFTLYMFSRDHRNEDMCVKVSMCKGAWPPYTAKSKPAAGPGVKKSLLGTINIGHGRKQVTYAGHPLYTYAFDSGPKATSYVGANQFGGIWSAVSAAGKAVK